jgi:hypothetical protein
MNLPTIVKLLSLLYSTLILAQSQLVNPVSDTGTQSQLPLTYYFNVTLNYSLIAIVFNYTNLADIEWDLLYTSNNSLACQSAGPVSYA